MEYFKLIFYISCLILIIAPIIGMMLAKYEKANMFVILILGNICKVASVSAIVMLIAWVVNYFLIRGEL